MSEIFVSKTPVNYRRWVSKVPHTVYIQNYRVFQALQNCLKKLDKSFQKLISISIFSLIVTIEISISY
jgi:hypothetical protein